MATLTRIVGLFVLLVCFCTLSSAQQVKLTATATDARSITVSQSWLDNAFHERDAQRGIYIPIGLGLAHYIPPVFVPTQTFQGNIQVSGVVNIGGLATLPRTNYFSITGTPTAVRTVTFPDASITVARSDAAQTITGVQTFVNNIIPSVAGAASVGQSGSPWAFLFFSGASGTAGTNFFKLTGTSTGGQRVITFPDSATTIPIFSQPITFAGPTAARTVTFPDQAFTAAGIDVAESFTQLQTFSAGARIAAGQTLTLANSQTVVEGLLSTTAAVDMNTATATLLYTCPAAKTCYITKVVLRNASTSLTTVSVAFGWTSASFNDVIATATHTELTGSTLATILIPKVGAKVDPGSGTFKVLDTILQGGAATVTIDVYGSVF